MISSSNTILAIEWDRNEVRYAVVSSAGRRIIVRDLGRIAALAEEGQGAAEAMIADVKGLIRVRKPRVIVNLNRSSVEEAETSLPPAADHEISQIIVNQAHERWPATSHDAVIDYYAMEDGPEGIKRFSIAVLDGERKKELDQQFQEIGWRISSLQLRHLASANLLRRNIDLKNHAKSVLLSLGRTEADLVIFSRDQIALVRTISLSSDTEEGMLAEKLAVEIQRSLVVTASADAPAEENTEPIFIFGSKHEQQSLADQLEKALSRNVNVLNPLDQLPRSNKEVPDRIHQFSALLGSVLEPLPAQSVDFVQPKCAKSVPELYKRLAVYGAAAVLLLAVVIWGGMKQVADLRAANRDLKSELTGLEKKVESMRERTKVVEDIEAWRKDDINWLEELRSLSTHFPDRSDAQVQSMSMSIGSSNHGIISMNVRAKDDLVISRLEAAVRDANHQVRTNQLSQDADDLEFPWHFSAQVVLTKRDRQEYQADAEKAPIDATPAKDTSTKDSEAPSSAALTSDNQNREASK
jgi:Tfp pilus assembly PilM family ATPase